MLADRLRRGLDLVEGGRDLVGVGHVALHAAQTLRRARSAVGDRHLVARGLERPGDRQPDAAVSSGHQNGPSHCGSPPDTPRMAAPNAAGARLNSRDIIGSPRRPLHPLRTENALLVPGRNGRLRQAGALTAQYDSHSAAVLLPVAEGDLQALDEVLHRVPQARAVVTDGVRGADLSDALRRARAVYFGSSEDTPRLVLAEDAQDLLFRQARTANSFSDEPVTDEQLRAIYDLVKWAPTSMNQ